jgi:LmeA-like phospholipid-binding
VRALLVVLLVLAALFVVADRVGAAVAEDQVADRIAEQAGLPGPPEVDITGFPFLTQAVSGTYDEVRIQLTAADLGQPEGTDADVALRGVQVPLSDVVAGSVQQVPVDRIDGTATLSYDLLSSQLEGDTTLERDGDGLRITRTVELLGQQVPLTASGNVTLDGSDLVVDVEEATGAGVDLPEAVVGRASDLLDLRYTIPPLPLGLQLTAVRPAEDGVVVDLEATGTVIGG